jgi:hypothetical protein
MEKGLNITYKIYTIHMCQKLSNYIESLKKNPTIYLKEMCPDYFMVIESNVFFLPNKKGGWNW